MLREQNMPLTDWNSVRDKFGEKLDFFRKVAVAGKEQPVLLGDRPFASIMGIILNSLAFQTAKESIMCVNYQTIHQN